MILWNTCSDSSAPSSKVCYGSFQRLLVSNMHMSMPRSWDVVSCGAHAELTQQRCCRFGSSSSCFRAVTACFETLFLSGLRASEAGGSALVPWSSGRRYQPTQVRSVDAAFDVTFWRGDGVPSQRLQCHISATTSRIAFVRGIIEYEAHV